MSTGMSTRMTERMMDRRGIGVDDGRNVQLVNKGGANSSCERGKVAVVACLAPL
jgi:hypothetical protein